MFLLKLKIFKVTLVTFQINYNRKYKDLDEYKKQQYDLSNIN